MAIRLPRLLLTVSRYPWPERSGDQRRTGELVTALAELGEVTVLAPEPPAGASGPPPGWAGRLETYRAPPGWSLPGRALGVLVSGGPLEWAYFGGTDLRWRFREAAVRADLVVVQLSRLAPLLDELPPGVPLAVDFIDSLATNFERRSAAGSGWLAPLFRLGAWRHRQAEAQMLSRAGAALVVAEGDRTSIAASLAPGLGPELGARLQVVPLVAPGTAALARVTEVSRPTIIVTGNLGYFPTRHGIEGFLRDVWPELRAARPDLDLHLAGARPPGSLVRTAEQAGARVTADPPALRPLLAAATVALAPLEAGTGQPIKVLEAWAEGVPVVASPAAAAGVGGRDGVDLRVAATPAEWQRAILDLLERPEERARLTAAGRARLAADFSPEAVTAAFRRVLQPLLLRGPATPASSG